MIKELKGTELVELIGRNDFDLLADSVFKQMSRTEHFKNDEPICIITAVYPIGLADWPYIIVEANCIKLGGSYDFGFQRLILSTTECPDVLLDRLNEYKEASAPHEIKEAFMTGDELRGLPENDNDYISMPFKSTPEHINRQMRRAEERRKKK